MLKLFYCLLFLSFTACTSAQNFDIGTKVKVKWGEFWYEGNIIEVKDGKFKVHYDGYGASYDDWRTKEELVIPDSRDKNITANTKTIPAANKSNDVTSTKTATGLTGKLYLRTSFFGSSLSISTIFLSNTGIIVRDAKNGIDPLDIEKEKQENKYNTGTYTINGDKMNVTWNDGKTVTWRVEYKNGAMSGLDGGIVTLQQKMPAGYRLNGRFSAMGVTANASSSQTYTFNNDGTFGLKSTGAVDNGEETGKSTDNKNGRYTISGNTLILQFNNGQITRSVICISTIGGRKHLIINRGSYPQE